MSTASTAIPLMKTITILWNSRTRAHCAADEEGAEAAHMLYILNMPVNEVKDENVAVPQVDLEMAEAFLHHDESFSPTSC